MKPDQVTKRLAQAAHYLELTRTSRELAYGATPYVIAAEHLIKLALSEQERISNGK